MQFRKSLIAGLIASLSLAPVPVFAGNDFLPGLIIGGIIGSEMARNNRNARNRTYRSRLPSTQEGKEIQASLNYFGFPAGRVDGQLGRKSRAAISSYQAYMDFPVTGNLTDYEKNFLITSYQRASLGGPAITQVVSTSPEGTRALLHHFRDELNGTISTSGSDTTMAAAEEPAGSLPSFFGSSDELSLASQCNQVSLLTNSNGGFTTEVSMSDPEFALSEQFCFARTYAIARGEELARKVQGLTPQQIEAQCDAFGPAMKEYVAALSLKPRDAVMQDVSGFVLKTGMSPAELAGTARICLSVGYRTDNMGVAIGSALLLTVLGEKPYGELMGHHLGLGFGASKRPDLALAWYDMAVEAVENGADAVFAPGQSERNSLIRKAAYTLNGASSESPGGQTQTGVLPTFSVKQ